jgi:hypothetical protein
MNFIEASGFPVDDVTLELLDIAINPGPDAKRSSLLDLLHMMSPEPELVERDGYEENLAWAYSPHCVIRSLLAEVRRLRAEGDTQKEPK